MKILYIGGQKSAKSKMASKKAIKISKQKPYYIATYDNSFKDKAMQRKINKHIKQRRDEFISIERNQKLHKSIKKNKTYLIDCISMWIFNNMHKTKKDLLIELKKICKKKSNIIFVLNDVNKGLIAQDKISRRFVDLSGIVGQFLAKKCDEVIEVQYGIEVKIK